MDAKILLMPGDGIGPEVTASAERVLTQVAEMGGHRFHFETALIGGAAIDAMGEPLPSATVEAGERSDAILFGAVGGPRWSDPQVKVRPEQGLLALRKHFELFANLRPVPVFPALARLAPIKAELLADVDILFVRELTGGIYFGQRQEEDATGRAHDTMAYSVAEVERIAHVAFRAARVRGHRVTSVDKANVLASMRLWRRTVERVAEEYPDVTLEHALVDACAMHLLRAPSTFDVVLAGNLFGDILSDEASMLAGSLGILPSASLGEGTFGLYEPIHGSAPDIAGQGKANPLGAVLSAAMLLRYSLGLGGEARRVEDAVAGVLEDGVVTSDLAPPGAPARTTEEVTQALCLRLGVAVSASV